MLRDHLINALVLPLQRSSNEGTGLIRSPWKLCVRQSLGCNLVLTKAAHEVYGNDST